VRVDILTRFAPAPTGYLHLGHVVNAIFVWGITHSTRARLAPRPSSGLPPDGAVLLRIEDHDRQRSHPEYEAAIVEDLAWLGFEADAPLVRQSERGDFYARALEVLRGKGLVYACACSRAEIASGRYPGTCRDRGLPEGRGVGLRMRIDDTVERFDDLLHGPVTQQPSSQCGDVLIRDREGNWTYQFAVAVDDMAQGITHVIRGDDLLASTGRQIQIARLLGRETPPRFLHHPLIMKTAGSAERFGEPSPQKLSKSDRDTGVRDLRAQGWTAPRVIGRAAFLAGLIPEQQDVRTDEVPDMMSAFTRGL
jgi:glutamyl/glutaminyl-tRNA synthetase